MLQRNQKEEIVSDLKEKFEKAEAVFLTNLIGVTSNASVAIRKKIRDVNGKVVVTRNTLFELAAKGTRFEKLLTGLKGPNALAFSFKDAPQVAKILFESSKEFSGIVDLKSGMLGDKILTSADVVTLAKLPSRDQMLGTLLATFNAPVSAFVRVLEQVRVKKEAA